MLKNFFKKIFYTTLTPFLLKDFFLFSIKDKDKRFSLKFSDFYPQIKDKTVRTGFDRHYVYHTSWAARIVKEINPFRHIDISSSLYFAGIVSAFMPVEFYDYRPADIVLDNLASKQGNLMHLPFADNSLQSLSCMHVVEHIGLGRYGDPIDPEGDMKAIWELKRVLAPSGSLLFVVPIGGMARIQFNAHRIYMYAQIREYFSDFELKEFALIPEDGSRGGLIRNADPKLADKERYGCGCFWFIKK